MSIFDKSKIGKWKIYCRHNTTDDRIAIQVLKGKFYRPMKLSKRDVLLDAGANIGAFSIWASSKVKKIIAAEPSVSNFHTMIKNLEANKLDKANITPLMIAVSGTDEKFRALYVNQRRSQAIHSLLPKRGRKTEIVRCVNINRLIQKYKITAIKMDIEGGEVEVIKAIEDKNWKRIKSLAVEFHHNALNDKDRKLFKKTIKILTKHFDKLSYKKDPKKTWTTMIYAEK